MMMRLRESERIGGSENASPGERAGEAAAVPPATEEPFIRLTSTLPRILLYPCQKPPPTVHATQRNTVQDVSNEPTMTTDFIGGCLSRGVSLSDGGNRQDTQDART